ncbi:MAG: hypothetical protein JWO05_64 [Gemmatimonadetes bacterium]|nr:hypothetical protein [Gemmatimonadota bacterium]
MRCRFAVLLLLATPLTLHAQRKARTMPSLDPGNGQSGPRAEQMMPQMSRKDYERSTTIGYLLDWKKKLHLEEPQVARLEVLRDSLRTLAAPSLETIDSARGAVKGISMGQEMPAEDREKVMSARGAAQGAMNTLRMLELGSAVKAMAVLTDDQRPEAEKQLQEEHKKADEERQKNRGGGGGGDANFGGGGRRPPLS